MNKDFINKLPLRFKQIVLAMPKFDGKKWLEDLPEIISNIEKKWSLEVQEHFSNLSYNYVAPCVCSDGKEAVLKIGLPQEDSEIYDEVRALEFYDGNGSVRLLKFDKEFEGLLLEKITPGKSLRKVFENERENAVEVAIGLLKKVLRKPPEGIEFPMLENWFDEFNKGRKSFPLIQFSKAARKFKKLNFNSNEWFLLHSDFHHDNILSSERDGFLTIDPKGMVGNVGYEIAVFLNNHAIWLGKERDKKEKINKAVEQFSKAFEISSKDQREWAYAQQVLSAWWNFEDNIGDWQKDLELAEIWEQIPN